MIFVIILSLFPFNKTHNIYGSHSYPYFDSNFEHSCSLILHRKSEITGRERRWKIVMSCNKHPLLHIWWKIFVVGFILTAKTNILIDWLCLLQLRFLLYSKDKEPGLSVWNIYDSLNHKKKCLPSLVYYFTNVKFVIIEQVGKTAGCNFQKLIRRCCRATYVIRIRKLKIR